MRSLRSLSRRAFLYGIGATVVAAGTTRTASARREATPFVAAVSCDRSGRARLTVTNVSDRPYELRDIDADGVDAVDGRPLLAAGSTYTKRRLERGTAVLQAYDPDTGVAVGRRIRVTIDCDPGDGQPLRVATSSLNDGTVSIENVADRPLQVRDLDAEGGDLLDGRPRLDPGAMLTLRGVAAGSYVVQAWDVDGRAPVGAAIRVDVGDRAFFDVSDVLTGSSTTAGDSFDVMATITNTGEGVGTRVVELRFDDEVVATTDVTLEAGEQTDIEFVLPGSQTIEFDPERTYTVTVDSGDDSDSTEKFVLSPQDGSVSEITR